MELYNPTLLTDDHVFGTSYLSMEYALHGSSISHCTIISKQATCAQLHVWLLKLNAQEPYNVSIPTTQPSSHVTIISL